MIRLRFLFSPIFAPKKSFQKKVLGFYWLTCIVMVELRRKRS